MFAEMPWTTIATSRSASSALLAGQVGDGDERVRLAGRRSRVPADERVDERGGERGGDEADPHVAARRRVAAEVGDARDQRQARAGHQRDDAGEADPGEVLVGRVEDAADVEARVVRRRRTARPSRRRTRARSAARRAAASASRRSRAPRAWRGRPRPRARSGRAAACRRPSPPRSPGSRSAAASACAANQYVAAITRYGELSRRAPQKPSVARAATWPVRP